MKFTYYYFKSILSTRLHRVMVVAHDQGISVFRDSIGFKWKKEDIDKFKRDHNGFYRVTREWARCHVGRKMLDAGRAELKNHILATATKVVERENNQ